MITVYCSARNIRTLLTDCYNSDNNQQQYIEKGLNTSVKTSMYFNVLRYLKDGFGDLAAIAINTFTQSYLRKWLKNLPCSNVCPSH